MENVQQYTFQNQKSVSYIGENPVEKIDNFINWGYLISLQQEIRSFVSSPAIKTFNWKTNLSIFLFLQEQNPLLYIVKVFQNFKESTRYLKVWIAKYAIKLQKVY